MHQASAFSTHPLPNELTMGACDPDTAWRRQNIVEIVHLAAVFLHSKSETFTLKELVKVARKFYRSRQLSESLIAGVLSDARVEADLRADALRLAD